MVPHRVPCARRSRQVAARTASGIDLDIRDDGAGFTGDPPPHPRTLAERSRANGGQLTIFNSKPGAHLLINLPDRNHP
jgi:signal transduction histidine kinase